VEVEIAIDIDIVNQTVTGARDADIVVDEEEAENINDWPD